MKIYKKIPFYKDGYNLTNLSCTDLIISRIVGYFNYDFQKYYSFLFTVYSTWSDGIDDDECSIKCLEKLNLVKEHIFVDNEDQALKEIQNYLEKDYLLGMLVWYNTLFYNSRYKEWNKKGIHCFAICGIDNFKETVALFDWENISVDIRVQANTQLISDFTITSEDFKFIFYHSLRQFKEFGNEEPMLFAIKQKENCNDFSTDILVQELLNSIKYNENIFNVYLDKFDEIMSNDNPQIYFERLKKTLSNASIIIFDVLEMIYKIPQRNFELREEFNELKKAYIDQRYTYTFKLLYHLIKKEKMQIEVINKFKTDIIEYDKLLVNLITKLKNSSSGSLVFDNNYLHIEKDELDYAIFATAISDSNYDDVHTADKAINGIISDDDQWQSQNDKAYHWLIIDLGESKKIHKFVLYHYPVYQYRIYSYSISGSNNLSDWTELVYVEENTLDIAKHLISPVNFRYFRLDILRSSISAQRVFLNEIQIIGYSQ